MIALVQAARQRRVTRMSLEVRESNRAAQDLYRQFAFSPVAVRPGYYQDTGEDALVMWAEDIDSPAFHERLMTIEERCSELMSGDADDAK